jgi:hypothetical protein
MRAERAYRLAKVEEAGARASVEGEATRREYKKHFLPPSRLAGVAASNCTGKDINFRFLVRNRSLVLIGSFVPAHSNKLKIMHPREWHERPPPPLSL